MMYNKRLLGLFFFKYLRVFLFSNGSTALTSLECACVFQSSKNA